MSGADMMGDEHPLLTQLIDLLADILVTSSIQNGSLPDASAQPGTTHASKESDTDLDSKDNRGHHEHE